jgi:hypothetical protein
MFHISFPAAPGLALFTLRLREGSHPWLKNLMRPYARRFNHVGFSTIIRDALPPRERLSTAKCDTLIVHNRIATWRGHGSL